MVYGLWFISHALKPNIAGVTGGPAKGSQKPWDLRNPSHLTTKSKPRLVGACFTSRALLTVTTEMQLCVHFVGRGLPGDRVIMTLNLS